METRKLNMDVAGYAYIADILKLPRVKAAECTERDILSMLNYKDLVGHQFDIDARGHKIRASHGHTAGVNHSTPTGRSTH